MNWYGLIAAAEGAEPFVDINPSAALAFAVVLLMGAVVFFFLEVMVPSFGVLTGGGLLCAACSIVLGFAVSKATGYTFVGLNIAAIPVVVFVAFRALPRSPVVVNTELKAAVPQEDHEAMPPDEELSGLMGKDGVAVTPLAPGGTARIGGKKHDVVTSGEFIDADSPIVVIEVEGNRIEVKQKEA